MHKADAGTLNSHIPPLPAQQAKGNMAGQKEEAERPLAYANLLLWLHLLEAFAAGIS